MIVRQTVLVEAMAKTRITTHDVNGNLIESFDVERIKKLIHDVKTGKEPEVIVL